MLATKGALVSVVAAQAMDVLSVRVLAGEQVAAPTDEPVPPTFLVIPGEMIPQALASGLSAPDVGLALLVVCDAEPRAGVDQGSRPTGGAVGAPELDQQNLGSVDPASPCIPWPAGKWPQNPGPSRRPLASNCSWITTTMWVCVRPSGRPG